MKKKASILSVCGNRRALWQILLLIIVFFLIITGIYTCPFKLLTGIDCPGCGLTRAFLAAFRLDFRKAFSYHPLFLIVGISLAYLSVSPLFFRKLRSGKTIELAVMTVNCVLLLIVWIIRLSAK